MFYFSKKSLEKVNNPKLHPRMREFLIEAISTSPIDFTVIETVRTVEQQKINVAKGVSKTMKSRHIPSTNKSGYCEAVDIAPYPINWKNTARFKTLAEHIKRTAERMGIKIEWGGDWKTLVDMPHYQLRR